MKQLIKYYIGRIQLHYKKKQLKKAVESARMQYELTGRKCLILQINGELRVMFKSNFKQVWQTRPDLKTRTIEQWENHSNTWFKCYEDLKIRNKFINSNLK